MASGQQHAEPVSGPGALFENDDIDEDDDPEVITHDVPHSESHIPQYSQPTRRNQFVGLLNQGATCYLNSLLQSFYFTPELREGLYQLNEKELGIDDIKEFEELNKKVHSQKYTFKDEDVKKLEELGFSKSRVE